MFRWETDAGGGRDTEEEGERGGRGGNIERKKEREREGMRKGARAESWGIIRKR